MRTCIWCPEPATRREDAWPVWLLKSIRKGTEFHIEAPFGSKNMYWFGPDPRIKVMFTCETCQHGWMSALESAVKPILNPLIHDRFVPIAPEHQRVIACWAVKTAMVFECCADRRRWFYSEEDRQHLMTTLSPPSDATVWIGRRLGGTSILTEARKLLDAFSESAAPDDVLREGFVVTFVFSHLVIQVLSLRRWPGRHVAKVVLGTRPGPWNQLLCRVWPTGSRIDWPPRLAFTDAGIAALGERFTIGRASS